jgi:TetR/AcrR family transcriptional repressor of nem operon
MPSVSNSEFDEIDALNRAMGRFASHGCGGSSLGDLETAMGLSRQAIYEMFGDKAALFRRCLEQYRIQAIAPLLQAISSIDDPERIPDLIFDFAEGCFGAQSATAGLLMWALVEMESVDPDIALMADGIFCCLKDAISRRLSAFADDGNFRRLATPERTAAALVTALLGLLAGARGEGTRQWLDLSLAQARSSFRESGEHSAAYHEP